MELLLTKTGTDMGNLRMELEKLICYTEGTGCCHWAEILKRFVRLRPRTVSFDMVRAVTEKNQKRALELYYDLLTSEGASYAYSVSACQSNTDSFFWPNNLQLPVLGKLRSLLNLEFRFLPFAMFFPAPGPIQCLRAGTVQSEDFVDAEESVKTGQSGR